MLPQQYSYIRKTCTNALYDKHALEHFTNTQKCLINTLDFMRRAYTKVFILRACTKTSYKNTKVLVRRTRTNVLYEGHALKYRINTQKVIYPKYSYEEENMQKCFVSTSSSIRRPCKSISNWKRGTTYVFIQVCGAILIDELLVYDMFCEVLKEVISFVSDAFILRCTV